MSWKFGQILYRARYEEHFILQRKGRPDDETGEQFVRYDEYRVVRVTPKGGWIRQEFGAEKWKSFGTKYAWETKEAALKSLKIRTRHYVRHCRRRLREAEKRAEDLGVKVSKAELLSIKSHHNY